MQKIAFECGLGVEDVGNLKQVCTHTRITLHDDEYARAIHFAMKGFQWCRSNELWRAAYLALNNLSLSRRVLVSGFVSIAVAVAQKESLDFFKGIVRLIKKQLSRREARATMFYILERMIPVIAHREPIDWMLETQQFPRKAVMNVPLEAKYRYLAIMFNMRHGHRHLAPRLPCFAQPQ